jgi:aryl-alcohol dehydrogenase-like predicted oxidoreductase
MEHRPLGRSGAQVSALCLGTMTFGDETDEATARAMVGRFLDLGGTFIDTADVYQEGAAEEITGRALRGRRGSVFLAAKGGLPMGGDPDGGGAGRAALVQAVESSLTRLGTDWIDLYQVHWPDPKVPIEDTLEALSDLVTAGKIRYVGLSNYLGFELQRGIDACDRYGWARIASHQPQYSLVSREIEFDSLLVCREYNIAVVPWSPLGGGILTGKYQSVAGAPEGTRLASELQGRRRLTERNLRIARAVVAIAADIGKTPAQVALNWLLHRPGVTAPIIGARNLGQLSDNLGAVGWQLDARQLASLDETSRLPPPYPHDFYRALFPDWQAAGDR